MIILQRRTLLILALVFSVMFLGIGVYGFQTASPEAQVLAEKVLFLSIVAALISLVTMLAALKRAISLDKRLDRLIEQGHNRDIVPGRDFSALGPLGAKLTILFNQLSELNYKKARKISAMASLSEFLIRNLEIPIVITDITGAIRYVSDIFLTRRELNRADILDENIETLIKDLVVPSLVMNISRIKEAVEVDGDKNGSYVCYPLTDRSGELFYLAFIFGTKASFQSVWKTTQLNSKKTTNAFISRLGHLITRKNGS